MLEAIEGCGMSKVEDHDARGSCTDNRAHSCCALPNRRCSPNPSKVAQPSGCPSALTAPEPEALTCHGPTKHLTEPRQMPSAPLVHVCWGPAPQERPMPSGVWQGLRAPVSAEDSHFLLSPLLGTPAACTQCCWRLCYEGLLLEASQRLGGLQMPVSL